MWKVQLVCLHQRGSHCHAAGLVIGVIMPPLRHSHAVRVRCLLSGFYKALCRAKGLAEDVSDLSYACKLPIQVDFVQPKTICAGSGAQEMSQKL